MREDYFHFSLDLPIKRKYQYTLNYTISHPFQRPPFYKEISVTFEHFGILAYYIWKSPPLIRYAILMYQVYEQCWCVYISRPVDLATKAAL